MTCEKCNGTGYYTHRTTFPLSYVGPGLCPDDARGMTDAKCDECHGESAEADDLTCEDCGEPALGFNDDGRALCEDCLVEDAFDNSQFGMGA
jgi:hypothetical protein